MLAAIDDSAESSAYPVPSCLCPWMENLYRPVGLWDMLQFSARAFYWIGQYLERSFEDCLTSATGSGDAPTIPIAALHEPINEQTKERVLICLGWVIRESEKVEMPITAATARELEEALNDTEKPPKYQWAMDNIRHLQKLVQKELENKTFLYIPPEKMKTWPRQNKQHVFGEQIHAAFPSAAIDISEAGICLSLSRATASVFHLMRVLEIGLTALGRTFSVSVAHTNWGPAIDQIESKIRDMHKDPTWKSQPDCKEQQQFYAQAASHFGILKDAWRNYTAHARGNYTEETAALIFDNVREFMRKLATRLHE